MDLVDTRKQNNNADEYSKCEVLYMLIYFYSKYIGQKLKKTQTHNTIKINKNCNLYYTKSKRLVMFLKIIT